MTPPDRLAEIEAHRYLTRGPGGTHQGMFNDLKEAIALARGYRERAEKAEAELKSRPTNNYLLDTLTEVRRQIAPLQKLADQRLVERDAARAETGVLHQSALEARMELGAAQQANRRLMKEAERLRGELRKWVNLWKNGGDEEDYASLVPTSEAALAGTAKADGNRADGGLETGPEPPAAERPARGCDHLWGYQNRTDPNKCYKCGKGRPVCSGCSAVMYGPVNGWQGDYDDPGAYFCGTVNCVSEPAAERPARTAEPSDHDYKCGCREPAPPKPEPCPGAAPTIGYTFGNRHLVPGHCPSCPSGGRGE